ncbi:MAG: hypothetical protein ACYTEZ_03655 [Planctomycetota bacterium]
MLLILCLGLACRARHGRPADRPLAEEGRETESSCVHCHGALDAPTMHATGTVALGCTACHGGDATAFAKKEAHVSPRPRPGREDPGHVRFVNPGDLRAAERTCGGCHASEVRRVRASMMAAPNAPAPGPRLTVPGTQDHPGDYRASGCTACHVVYANDRKPAHSADYARYGNTGFSFSSDPTLPKRKSGHPIRHVFTRAVPTSQCLTCHSHPNAADLGSYVGMVRWDTETEGHRFYPRNQRHPTKAERRAILRRTPEEAAVRGLWSDGGFLKDSALMNPSLDKVQLADFHSQGSLFRKVFRRDTKGDLLDARGRVVSPSDPEKFARAVHLRDIHLERGMHCIDCHFEQDVHGDGQPHGSAREAVAISCEDCHGTIERHATLRTSGPAAPEAGHDLARMRTSFGQRRFVRRGRGVFQRSAIYPDWEWEVPQIADGAERNRASWRAKTLQRDNETWGDVQGDLAHPSARMTCQACHTSWTASWRRADAYMLGIAGDAAGNRVAPARAGPGGSRGITFSIRAAHTVRRTETRRCTDCHPSRARDNNALMAQLLMQGTGFLNSMGGRVYVGTERGIEAVVVAERDEPRAVIGSTLHRVAFPDRHKQHLMDRRQLKGGYRLHVGRRSRRANSVQLRGDRLCVADGPGGLRVFATAGIDRRGDSGGMARTPFVVRTMNATGVAAPTTFGTVMHPLYTFSYVADSEEGLVITAPGADPRRRALTFNPDGLLKGARTITLAGRFAYLGCDRGLVVVDLEDPARPAIASVISRLEGVRGIAVQFRYAFVACAGGLASLDVTSEADGSFKKEPSVVSLLELEDARQVYVARTYAYVAAGRQGLAIVDVTRPEEMKLVQVYDARGFLDDCNDVKLGLTHASLFAYVADGRNGLRVIQLTDPVTDPRVLGFSPRPDPRLVATFKTKGRALSIGRGLDRDRAVDESGNRIAAFDRRGARALAFQEMTRLYRLPDGTPFTVE